MRVSAERTQSRVQAATYQRLLANVATAQGDCEEASTLLQNAKQRTDTTQALKYFEDALEQAEDELRRVPSHPGWS